MRALGRLYPSDTGLPCCDHSDPEYPAGPGSAMKTMLVCPFGANSSCEDHNDSYSLMQLPIVGV